MTARGLVSGTAWAALALLATAVLWVLEIVGALRGRNR